MSSSVCSLCVCVMVLLLVFHCVCPRACKVVFFFFFCGRGGENGTNDGESLAGAVVEVATEEKERARARELGRGLEDYQ